MEATIRELQDRIRKVLLSGLYHNQLDLDVFAEDSLWFVGSAMTHLTKSEIGAFLAQNSIEQTIDSPDFEFVASKEICHHCVSLIGEIRYHGIHQPDRLILISFQCLWTEEDGEWKIQQLITTNRREADEGMKESRIDGKLLLKSIPMGIVCCVRNDFFTMELINEKAQSLLGYDSISEFKQKAGTSFLGIIHPDDIEDFKNYVDRLSEGPVEDYIQFRARKKDFTYTWIQALGMIVQEEWVVLACTDYSAHQKQLEEAEKEKLELSELQASYRSMIDNMPSGFHSCALFDPVHLDYVSESLCKMTGYSQYDIHEKMDSIYLNLVVPEDHHIIIESVKSLMQYPHTEQIEYRMKKKDGTIMHVLDRMRSVRRSDGNMWGYSIVIDMDNIGRTNPTAPPVMLKTDPVSTIEAVSAQEVKNRVEIHTFGYFEVLVDGNPIAFRSAKARELLAFLVDRRGNYVSRENIITALWENETVNSVTVTRCRKTYKYLVDELKSYGIESIVSTENNMRRLVKANVTCDLYDYLEGKPGAEDAFMGAYLSEYSWAEITLSGLLQQFEEM